MDITASERAKQKPIPIFFCYAREDEPLLNQLKNHLQPLQRRGLIELWYDREIRAGSEWGPEIKKRLDDAHIILLLVSPDFMASDYCYGIEMQRALERHQRGEATVIPIILRDVFWHEGPLGSLQALPTDGEPVTSRAWASQDQAFYTIVVGIRRAVETRRDKEEQLRKAEAERVEKEEQLRKAEAERVEKERRRFNFAKDRTLRPHSKSQVYSFPRKIFPLQWKVRRRTFIALTSIAVLGGGVGFFVLHPYSRTPGVGSNLTPTPTLNSIPTPDPTPTPDLTSSPAPFSSLDKSNNLLIGSTSTISPALATLNNTLYIAFVDTANSNNLRVTSSSNGTQWNLNPAVNQTSSTTPGLAFFRNNLVMAFVTNDNLQNLVFITSQDGKIWSPIYSPATSQYTSQTPAMAVLNNRLYTAFIEIGGANILLISSPDGTDWSGNIVISPSSSTTPFASSTPPALATLQKTLYLAFVDAGTNRLMVSTSRNGSQWSFAHWVGPLSASAPALVTLNDTLYLVYISYEGTNRLYTTSSKDGVKWTNASLLNKVTPVAPALATWKNRMIAMTFVSNDYTNQLMFASAMEMTHS